VLGDYEQVRPKDVRLTRRARRYSTPTCPCQYRGSRRYPHLLFGALMVDVRRGRVASELVSRPRNGESFH
jgi:hypothetical protein